MKRITRCIEIALRNQVYDDFWQSHGLKKPELLTSWAYHFLNKVIPTIEKTNFNNDNSIIELSETLSLIKNLLKSENSSTCYSICSQLEQSILNTFTTTIYQNSKYKICIQERKEIEKSRKILIRNLVEMKSDALNSIPEPPPLNNN